MDTNTVSGVYSTPLTEQLERSLTELYTRERELKKALVTAVEVEGEYKLKLAKEYRLAEGTEKARTHAAMEACADLYLEHLKTEAIASFTREAMKNAQQALSARQTLLTASTRGDLGYTNDRRIT